MSHPFPGPIKSDHFVLKLFARAQSKELALNQILSILEKENELKEEYNARAQFSSSSSLMHACNSFPEG